MASKDKQHRSDQPRAALEKNRLDETKVGSVAPVGNSAPGKHKRGKQG